MAVRGDSDRDFAGDVEDTMRRSRSRTAPWFDRPN